MAIDRAWQALIGSALIMYIAALAQAATVTQPALVDGRGPYNLSVLEGGIGASYAMTGEAAATIARGARWSLSGWIEPSSIAPGLVPLFVIGDPTASYRRVSLDHGRLAYSDPETTARASAPINAGRWTAIAVTSDGMRISLFVDGRKVATSPVQSNQVAPTLAVAPTSAGQPHFGGRIAALTLFPRTLSAIDVAVSAHRPPHGDLIAFQKPGQGWEWQEKAWRGLFQPQDPATLPVGLTAPSAPTVSPPDGRTALTRLGSGRWQVGGWRLGIGPDIGRTGSAISAAGFDDSKWLMATVPGTVLTTLVDRGVYPDPAYGLNNLAIPEKLGRQDYWYRTGFDLPAGAFPGRRHLLFKGINYAAEIWINGNFVGRITGAFIRGDLDVSKFLHAGRNSVAVHILPPPHPGIAHEESIAAGPGNNGGQMALDGPTFVATEGWDWIPGVRDRDVGLWQGVELVETGQVRIGDPQVVTKLPLPAIDTAAVSITVPIVNDGAIATDVSVSAAFGDIAVSKTVLAPPGRSEVRFAPETYPQLSLKHPKLWWPNGYGAQDLYTLKLTVATAGVPSDEKSLRFGMRELTYGLSLFDGKGSLHRVEVDPTLGHERGETLIALAHEDIKATPDGWAESLTPAGETSPAVRDIRPEMREPHMTIFVNGVPIAARGGNWGMDDFMKRVSRSRLEPYFRLHKDANINIIRNWVGQNTEDVFYDLADEYGMLILNDFWESTQDYQNEAEDPRLFLDNAADVISRYRNHPSIAVWFGRNEGVPQPIINEGLNDLVQRLDGTRYYTSSSNRIGLQDSGPYSWQDPAKYFTTLDTGFSVEDGTPSLATIESIEAMIPPADRWPISDTLAYHDWHIGGNGDVRSFMRVLAAQYGDPISLEDFERKAQMLNYVDYRAIFEGFNAGLWTRNSGRLLWMTHPAWPSNHWQIYSSDYDTAASYYGVKTALEPVHVQMNLPDFALAVTNTTRSQADGLTLHAHVVDISGNTLLDRRENVSAPANQTITLGPLAIRQFLAAQGLIFIELTLSANQHVISHNFYWQGRDDAAYRQLNGLPTETLTGTAKRVGDKIVVQITNNSEKPMLAAKLTLMDGKGERVLPAFYDDNYVSLLAGERRSVTIRTMDGTKPSSAPVAVKLRGWNVAEASLPIQ